MSAPQPFDWITLAMAVLTGWMAWETRRMAKVASDSLLAAQQPYMSLHAVDLSQGKIAGPHSTAGSLGVQITLQLKNPGSVRINYDVELADFTIAGHLGPRGPYDNHAGVIFPGDVHGFRLPPLVLPSPLPLSTTGVTGTLTFRARYWATPNERRTLDFTIGFVASADLKWVYQRGPTYA
jgi:hypothetical protein